MSGKSNLSRTHTDRHGLARTLAVLGPSWAASPVRRLVQSVCLLGFLALFFWVCWPYGSKQYAEAFRSREIVDAELYLVLDPLVSISTAIAARMLVWSLAAAAGVILISLLLPRAFCGYVCPLGTLFDVFDWLIGDRVRLFRLQRRGWWSHTRYWLLAIVLIAAIFGVLLSGFVAAIPVLTRTMLFVLSPAQTGLLKGWYLVPPANLGHVVSILLFALMLGLVFLGRRFWCRHVCPTGALLSLCSVLRLTERRVTGKCVKCGRCVEACSFDAINADFSTRPLNCASCRTCSGVCPADAIEFGWRRRKGGSGGSAAVADGLSAAETSHRQAPKTPLAAATRTRGRRVLSGRQSVGSDRCLASGYACRAGRCRCGGRRCASGGRECFRAG